MKKFKSSKVFVIIAVMSIKIKYYIILYYIILIFILNSYNFMVDLF